MKRLLLFDIDGTLVSGGPAKVAFREALISTYATTGPIDVHDFSGKTDPQIARELLRLAGLEDTEIDVGLPTLFQRYVNGLEARLPRAPMTVLPGVPALVTMLEGVADVALGLVTGNVVAGARAKLRGSGLDGRFPVGAFGSDSEERNDLPGIAVERARVHWGTTFAPDEVIVIGDTPRDVECGRAHGLRTLAVATGNFDADTLRAAGADAVVSDFSATSELRELLLAG